MKPLLLALLAALLPLPAIAEGEHVHASPYVGQELREIKSLSAEDVSELEKGGGWGLAKAAELNGMPGPSHVLKMKRELDLTTDQEASTQRIFAKMRDDAAGEGKRLIAAEMALEADFRERSIDEDSLRARLRQIEASRATLRYIHLVAHLQMMRILNEDQVKRYNELRGYRR
ncbi:Spy/CpxP family protein refolding chaperone [Sinorhizobium numidicum]|uniref:Spy/CpxP family protein refolding chaperone n=1 Tax=Sinorhizobium numidicum TaxID=680248 RepID=A0ABY8D6L0_9HYPH|nr:Spy/CpxP family protein refolding chaperone [Sinorhizobium numidicum]WEX79169.1 Spy/CpxP family protein refolding chaperone [Sinorhizobium numidicum]WEX85195.1 Spy/CpxP family protein refolding chaperone [Sinorhizobium numidicum]